MEIKGVAGLVPSVSADRLSVLVQPPPLVVRWDPSAVGLDAGEGERLAVMLGAAPTVTVLVADPSGPPPALVDAFDVCLTEHPEPPAPWGPASSLGGLTRAVEAQPLASLALVALLRSRAAAGLHGDVWGGLAAESATYAALLRGGAFATWLASRGPATPALASPAVALARAGNELEITLDRPDVHNAFNTAMRDELVEAFQLAAADATISEVRLRGNGPSFCSGGDLSEFGSVGDPAVAHAVRLTRHPGYWAHLCRDRLKVQVHGACVGAGIEVPAFAGHISATADSFFALPEVGMGLIPGAGGTVSITRRIGRQRCAWLALTGARLDAASALRWGLVDEVT